MEEVLKRIYLTPDFALNEIEKIYGVSNRVEMNEVERFSKEDYVKVVQSRRREFIHDHFGGVLDEVYTQLRRRAEQRKNCHLEVEFECPEHFDVDKIEGTLRDYFRDNGYETVAEARKGHITTITLTIT